MPVMLRQTVTIAQNTFTESIRQPVYTVVLLVAAAGLALNPSLSAYSMETGEGDKKLLVDMGLSVVFLAGMLLAAFTATGVLSHEIEQKTVLTVVSKPVARPLFVLGKFLGVAAAIALAYWVLSLLFLCTYRHGVMSTARDDFDLPVIGFTLLAALTALAIGAGANYLYNWSFTSTFIKTLAVTMTAVFVGVLLLGKGFVLQNPLTDLVAHRGELVEVMVGLFMIFQAVLILTALAVAVSTRLGQVMTLMICIGTFMLGAVTSSLSGKVNERLNLPHDLEVLASVSAVFGADSSWAQKAADVASKLIYLVVPNLQFLWPADAITQGHSLISLDDGSLSFVALGQVSLYAALYTTALLALAVVLFQRREVG